LDFEPWSLAVTAPRVVPDNDWLWHRVGKAAVTIVAELAPLGLRTSLPDERAHEDFRLASLHLSYVPSLQAAVHAAVDEIVCLDAPRGYDISHSEPRWPATIFVSPPRDGSSVSSLRLLESIVHEAMHLQLTKLEKERPLVLDGTGRTFSPWKGESRAFQGVLHGVYVFVCIAALFDKAALFDSLDQKGAAYVVRRCSEIALELDSVDMDALTGGLTDDGRLLLSCLTKKVRTEPPHHEAMQRNSR
jgi:HEXXH motif-containing protein